MSTKKPPLYVGQVVEYETGRVMSETRPMSKSMADRWADGRAVNLSADYFTRVAKAKKQ